MEGWVNLGCWIGLHSKTVWTLEHGIVPSTFNHAYISRPSKKTNLHLADIRSYRPISNLSVLSKLLDRMVRNYLLKYLKDNGLLPDLQSAYCAHHSTGTALFKDTWATYYWLWTRATYRCWHFSICRSVGCIRQCGSRHASAAYADIILRSGLSGTKLVQLVAAWSYTIRPTNGIQIYIATLCSRIFRGQRVRLASTTCLGGQEPAGFSWITRRAKSSGGRLQELPTGPVHIGSTPILPVSSVGDFGVYIDAEDSQLRSMRRCQDMLCWPWSVLQWSAKSITASLFSLAFPEVCLQSVLNSATRLVCSARKSEYRVGQKNWTIFESL